MTACLVQRKPNAQVTTDNWDLSQSEGSFLQDPALQNRTVLCGGLGTPGALMVLAYSPQSY